MCVLVELLKMIVPIRGLTGLFLMASLIWLVCGSGYHLVILGLLNLTQDLLSIIN